FRSLTDRRKDTAAYASLPLSTMSKSKHLAMQSKKETSAEQTLFPTEVGPQCPVSEEVLAASRNQRPPSMGGI
ncbi:hypothetical protein AAII07_43770, partial [Microvirga sp. 0TCS3.31]